MLSFFGKTGVRMVGTQAFLMSVGGLITGYGPLNAIFDIGAPTMSGGALMVVWIGFIYPLLMLKE